MLVGILDGMVAGLPLDIGAIDAQLKRRMAGYGRGKRMKIESDAVNIVGGVRHGETLGSPIAWLIENRDWPNWRDVMAIESPEEQAVGGATAESGNRASDAAASARRVTRPRPGHADLVGGLKFDRSDLRDILERASARETAVRVAAGAIARQLLEQLGIRVGSHVTRIGAASVPEPIRTIWYTSFATGVAPVKSTTASLASVPDRNSTSNRKSLKRGSKPGRSP